MKKNNHLLKFCASLFALAYLAHPAIAGEDDINPQDLGRFIANPGSQVVVAVQTAWLFLAPDEALKPTQHVRWTDRLQTVADMLTTAPTGWIPVEPPPNWRASATGQKSADAPAVWIRRRDIALPHDYKKIIGCWPIKSFMYEGGDYGEAYNFKPNGTATVKEMGDSDWIDKRPLHKVQLAIAKDLVIAQGKSAEFVMGYRANDRTPFPSGIAGDDLKRFTDAELKGCESGLRLAP